MTSAHHLLVVMLALQGSDAALEPEVWLRGAAALLANQEGVLDAQVLVGADPAERPCPEGAQRIDLPMGDGTEARLSLFVTPALALDEHNLTLLRQLLRGRWSSARLNEARRERQQRVESAYLQHHRELNALRARYEKATEIQDRFLALLSHDLRSPIAVIMGQCQLLAEGLMGTLNPRQVAAVAAVARNGERMNGMVEQLLDAYRAGRSPAPRTLGPIQMGDVARDVVEAFQALATRKGVVLSFEESGPAEAHGDLASLREVIANLVDNAIRHTRRGGRVTLHTEVRGGEVCCLVDDEGPGFPEDMLDSRLERKLREPGTSLGLRLSVQVLADLGGELRLVNRPDGGGRAMVITLARDADTSPPHMVLASANLDRIDELRERFVGRWEVTTINRGDELLYHCRTAPADIIILEGPLADGMDAPEVLAQLAGDAEVRVSQIVVVVMDVRKGPELLAAGASAVLGLPIDGQALRACVERALQAAMRARRSLAGDNLDPVTGLGRLRAAAPAVIEMGEQAEHAGRGLPALVVDVTGLKKINGERGFAAGDQTLAWLATQVRRVMGPGDLALRGHSDALVLVMPSSSLEDATTLARGLVGFVGQARPRVGSSRVDLSVSSTLLDLSRPPDRAVFQGLE